MWCQKAALRRLGVKRDELIAKLKAGKELEPEEIEAVRLGQVAYGALMRHAPPLGLVRSLRPLHTSATTEPPRPPRPLRQQSICTMLALTLSHAVWAANLGGAMRCPKATQRRLGVKGDLVAKIRAAEEELLPEELEAVRLGQVESGALRQHMHPL